MLIIATFICYTILFVMLGLASMPFAGLAIAVLVLLSVLAFGQVLGFILKIVLKALLKKLDEQPDTMDDYLKDKIKEASNFYINPNRAIRRVLKKIKETYGQK